MSFCLHHFRSFCLIVSSRHCCLCHFDENSGIFVNVIAIMMKIMLLSSEASFTFVIDDEKL